MKLLICCTEIEVLRSQTSCSICPFCLSDKLLLWIPIYQVYQVHHVGTWWMYQSALQIQQVYPQSVRASVCHQCCKQEAPLSVKLRGLSVQCCSLSFASRRGPARMSTPGRNLWTIAEFKSRTSVWVGVRGMRTGIPVSQDQALSPGALHSSQTDPRLGKAPMQLPQCTLWIHFKGSITVTSNNQNRLGWITAMRESLSPPHVLPPCSWALGEQINILYSRPIRALFQAHLHPKDSWIYTHTSFTELFERYLKQDAHTNKDPCFSPGLNVWYSEALLWSVWLKHAGAWSNVHFT